MNPEVNTEGSPMVGTTTPLAGCKRKASALDSETGNESDGSTKLFSPAQEASRRRDEARKGSSGSQKSRGFAKPTPGSGEKALKAAGGSRSGVTGALDYCTDYRRLVEIGCYS